MAVAIAFAERKADLVPMTIFRSSQGTLVARRRRPEDRIQPAAQIGAFNDLWRRVRSGGRYIRHDEVLDEETGELCYDYSCWNTGRLWLRPVSDWHARVDGRPRFEPFGELP